MVHSWRIFALAVALPLLGGGVTLHASSSPVCIFHGPATVFEAASFTNLPANPAIPLASSHEQFASGILESFEFEPLTVILQLEVARYSLQSCDGNLSCFCKLIDPSLVSQHVRLQI